MADTQLTTAGAAPEALTPAAMDRWLSYAPPPPPLGAGQEWNVFLSYRSLNRPWVINLYDVLRERGHKVFLDQCALVGGDALTRALETALSRSQAGVLCWSSASEDSEWVRREYATMESMAEGGGFRFVPICLDHATLPAFARHRLFVDFSQYPDGPNGGTASPPSRGRRNAPVAGCPAVCNAAG